MDYENIYDQLVKMAESANGPRETFIACVKFIYTCAYEPGKYLVDEEFVRNCLEKLIPDCTIDQKISPDTRGRWK